MSSSVVAFCERHSLTTMLNFLRHSGPTSGMMQEVFAVDLLEQLLAGDAAKLEELQAIRAQIHPLAKAARHRAAFKQFQEERARKENEIIAALRSEIETLRVQLDQKRSAHPPAAVFPTPRADDETQRFEVDDETLRFGGSPQGTQPEAAAADYRQVIGLTWAPE